MTPEKRLSELMQILKEEYGIETQAQLMEAISKLEPIDISIFVCPPPSRSSDEHD